MVFTITLVCSYATATSVVTGPTAEVVTATAMEVAGAELRV